MNDMETPTAEDTEGIPPPPEGYDAEKLVVFLFETSGRATLIWDYQLNELRYLTTDYAIYKDWQRELFVPDKIKCTVLSGGRKGIDQDNELEEFTVNVEASPELIPAMDPPRFGVVQEDYVFDGEHEINGPWKLRDQIRANQVGLKIGESTATTYDLMTSGRWDRLNPDEDFYAWGNCFTPVDASNWPYSPHFLTIAIQLVMDVEYILHYSTAANKPPTLEILIWEIARGPGWETLLEMVEQMPEDKRRWLNCVQEDIHRLLREVNRNHAGTTRQHHK
jgi:hypothetical protein